MNVICYGDSNTYGYDPTSLFGEPFPEGICWTDILKTITGWNIINEGMNGREIPDHSESFPEDADLIIIMLGTNDLLQFWTPSDAAGKMRVFLNHHSPIKSKLLLIPPPVMQPGAWVQDQELIDDSRKLAEEYRDLAESMGIRFCDSSNWNIPLAHDGVHMTQKGHRVFAEKLADFLINE